VPSPRRFWSFAVVILLLEAALSGAVPSADAAWEGHGPGGGETFVIAVDPSNSSTVYVSTLTQLYKSIDGGESWHDAGAGLPVEFDVVRVIAVDPSDSNVVYVAMDFNGVYKSTNGGLAFSAANAGLPGFGSPMTWALAIDPQTPATLYVGANVDGGHVYKSTDGAASWSLASNGLPVDYVYSLAIDPETPSTVYVGCAPSGVHRTVDGGGTWAPRNTGLSAMAVTSLAISLSNPSRIYAGTPSGLFRTNNGGQSWTDQNDGLTSPFIQSLIVDPTDSSEVYITNGDGLFVSHNGGNTWNTAGPGLPLFATPRMLAIDPITPTTIYVTTLFGVYKSTTPGPTWSFHSEGISASTVTALAVDPVTPTTVYASTWDRGLSKSTDGTRTWHPPTGGLAFAIAIDPATPSTLYLGQNGGVTKSTDGGANWNVVSTGLPATTVFALAIDPATTSTVYAGLGGGNGVYKSTDGAGGWSAANVGLGAVTVVALAIDPATPTTLYAGTASGVFKSVDGAATWNPASTGLAGTGLVIRDLAIDPATPATLYAATDAGVVRSVDGAASWGGPTTTAGGRAVAVEVDPVTTTVVYAAVIQPPPFPSLPDFGTVEKSTTSGATWSVISSSLFTHPTTLAIAPSSSTHLYQGTIDGGVLAHHDCGNGSSEPLEECDDGNVTSGDGCSATCGVEPCPLSALPLCGGALQAQLQVSEKTPGKEKLKLQWKRITGVTSSAAFGDPIGGSTRVALCLYDDAKTLVQGYEVDRAGDTCSGKPCWAAKGTNGLSYKDKLAAADGITAVTFKSGPSGKGQASAAGANNPAKGQTALPTGVVGVLSGNTRPTVQLQTSDGLCIGATMTETTKDEGGIYKARKK
jgi:cysteine-rich repeat protein